MFMNVVVWSVVIAGVSAQLIKILLNVIHHRDLSLKDLVVTGGMPSSHSAFVSSLAMSIYLLEGISSTFMVSLVLAMVVLRDAFGVRLTVGKEGDILKKLLQKHRMNLDFKYSRGHTLLQVAVGTLFGVVVAILVAVV
jgi:uncharacterized protein